MTDPTDVCRHGGLRRKCEPCDLAQEVKELTAEVERLKRAWDSSFAQALQNGEAVNRLRAALTRISEMTGHNISTVARGVARHALGAPNEPEKTT